LTLKSLVAACNQATNRDPVVAYDEHTATSCLDSLKVQRLVRFVLPSHGRTAVRYRHVLDEALGLTHAQCALMAVLVLRGPQTVGELRLRTERMTHFDSLEEIDHQLRFLSSMEEPLAVSLGRAPGQKEERGGCPLDEPTGGGRRASEPDALDPDGRIDPAGGDEIAGLPPSTDQRLDDLAGEIAALRSVIGELRRALDSLRASLGG
jgi:uncharacterized protein YceH (UPF0502 family)